MDPAAHPSPSEGIKEALGLTKPARRSGIWDFFLGGLFIILFVGSVGAGVLIPHDRQLVSPLVGDGRVKGVATEQTHDVFPPNNYFPANTTPIISESVPGVTSTAYAAMERGTKQLLVAKNLTVRHPIASLTKVMTAVVALEHSDPSSEFLVSNSATKAGEATMGLTTGERVTLEELLYGLLLPSGNDAAETIAEGIFQGTQAVGGVEDASMDMQSNASRATFLAKMNAKAASLGMYDTHYVNPTGLDGDSLGETTQSTVLDLLALGNFALTNPTVAKIVSTKFMSFPYKAGYHKAFYLTNILDLRQSYPGVAGIKPGNTDFAKETLLSYAQNGGKEIILVLLGSERTRDDAVKLYDLIFDKLGVKVDKKVKR